jgi:hypothetical protein
MEKSNFEIIGDKLSVVFSGIFLVSINVAISGYYIGRILELENRKERNSFFRVRIPVLFNFEIYLKEIIAGFISLSLSLAAVGFWFHDFACNVFITNTEITGSKSIACMLLSGSGVIALCVVISVIKIFVAVLLSKINNKINKKKTLSEKERVEELIKEIKHE